MEFSGSNAASLTPKKEVYTVSRLNLETRALLEREFALIWVEGEISNLARPASGHIYFSLKDTHAQVRCAMFRNRNRSLSFKPENGTQVLVRARVSLYEGRGEFQLIAEHMEDAGEGQLRRDFEALKEKLAKEGLFDARRKKDIPKPPSRLGILTSPSGAAIRDILSVLKRRFPGLPIVLYPVPVQGDRAAIEIEAAMKKAVARNECDLLLLSRGGGSLEDLQAFNDESLARTIAACPIPTVSAIGHEIDFTIADFVADFRAPTPSAAAELVTPDTAERLDSLSRQKSRLESQIKSRLTHSKLKLDQLSKRLQQSHPGYRLDQQKQRVDTIQWRLNAATTVRLDRQAGKLSELASRLMANSPAANISLITIQTHQLMQRLITAIGNRQQMSSQRLTALSRNLDAVSPLATLGRGYAVVARASNSQLVKNSRDIAPGEKITAQLAQGKLYCEVIDADD